MERIVIRDTGRYYEAQEEDIVLPRGAATAAQLIRHRARP